MNMNMTAIPMFLFAIVMLALIMLWFASLVDCLQNETEQKALWVALLLIGGGIVGPVYWFLQRPNRERAQSLARYGNQRSDLIDILADRRSAASNALPQVHTGDRNHDATAP